MPQSNIIPMGVDDALLAHLNRTYLEGCRMSPGTFEPEILFRNVYEDRTFVLRCRRASFFSCSIEEPDENQGGYFWLILDVFIDRVSDGGSAALKAVRAEHGVPALPERDAFVVRVRGEVAIDVVCSELQAHELRSPGDSDVSTM